jgi:RHS repeat-associated protein
MTTKFLYDGPNPVQEQQGSTVTANLLTGGVDERFQRTDATGSYSYLTDALGSTEALTNSTGAEQASYTYSPYGAFSITGSTTNSYDYTGRESDGLGLHYYRARYYNPTLGRFISEDPMGLAAGPNEYAYVDDSPLNFVDRFGLATTVVIWNPVGYGESSQGHASIIINGISCSFGPGGMSIMPADQYLARNESFRNGLGDNLNLTPDQEQKLANYLRNYKQGYNLLAGRNCTTPIRDGLRSVGLNVPTPFDFDSFIPFPLEWYPSDLQWAIENTPGLVTGWTGCSKY